MMKVSKISFIKVFILFIFIFLANNSKSQLVMLSGVSGGSYERFANDIKKVYENVEVIPSKGSIDNFNKLISNRDIEVTFLQEDVLVHQQLRDLESGTNNIDNIRILFPFGYEEIHLIVKKESNIKSITDLTGKKVNIGTREQGTYITSRLIKEISGIKWYDAHIKYDSIFSALKKKKIDASFFVGAAPVKVLMSRNDIRIIPLKNKLFGEIYYKSKILAKDYACLSEDVETYAVKNVLATNILGENKETREKITELLTSIKDNIETLRKIGHDKWQYVDFNYDNVDWEIHDIVDKIFIKKPPTSTNIVLLSGVKGGSYNQFAKDIKKIAKPIEDILTSKGSKENLSQLIVRDKIYVTFLQYDVLINQKMEDSRDGTSYSNDIKILLPLANEEIHLVARKNSKIKSLRKLKRKKVAIGTINQGTRVTANVIKKTTRSKWIDVPLPFDSALSALLQNKIDAFFFVGTAPVSKLKKLRSSTNIKLVPITNNRLKKIYGSTIISKDIYSWMDEDVKTYSVKSVLATNVKNESEQEKENIKQMLTDIKNEIAILRKEGHPKWKEVEFNFKNIKWDIYNDSKEMFKNLN